MQLRHMKTVQPAKEGEGVMDRVTALCWAPNNMRLAAVTTDRIVHLFDENGERRDKFSTKPADSKVLPPPPRLRPACVACRSCFGTHAANRGADALTPTVASRTPRPRLCLC